MIFNHAFGDLGDDELGERTRELGMLVYRRLLAGDVAESVAEQWTLVLAAVFGPTKPKDKEKKKPFQHLINETMLLVSPAEKRALLAYVDKIIAEKLVPPAVKGKDEMEKEAKKIRPLILRRRDSAVDRSLFGRLFAGDKSYSVEGSLQVAHSFSVHSAEITDDVVLAVDDLKLGDSGDDNGAGFMGEAGLGAAVYYNYASLHVTGLKENLTYLDPSPGDSGIVVVAEKLVESFMTEFPKAKGNSCAQQSRAFYGRVEFGQKTARNLALAYLDPIDGKGVGRRAIRSLQEMSANMDKVCGSCYGEMYEFDVLAGTGSLAELLAFVRRVVGGVA
jgi:CRISPR system Cascade subunit CasC